MDYSKRNVYIICFLPSFLSKFTVGDIDIRNLINKYLSSNIFNKIQQFIESEVEAFKRENIYLTHKGIYDRTKWGYTELFLIKNKVINISFVQTGDFKIIDNNEIILQVEVINEKLIYE